MCKNCFGKAWQTKIRYTQNSPENSKILGKALIPPESSRSQGWGDAPEGVERVWGS